MPSLAGVRRAFTPSHRRGNHSTSTTTSTTSTSTTTTASSSSASLLSTASTAKSSISSLSGIVLERTASGLRKIRISVTINEEVKHRRRVEEYERRDVLDYDNPTEATIAKRSRIFCQKTQDALRLWEFRDREPRVSFESGLSPCSTTRVDRRD